MEYWKTLMVRPDQNVVQPEQKERDDRLKQMKSPYESAMEERWEDVTKYFEGNAEKLLYNMTAEGDTALHLAASRSSKSQGTEVLQMFINILRNSTSYDVRCALRLPNSYGNNTLHEVSVSGNEKAAKYLLSNFNDPVLGEVVTISSSTDKDCDMKLREVRDLENSKVQLLETRNYLGETPLFRAAALGHADLVKFYASKLPGDNLWKHFHRDDKKSILHMAVIAQHFEIALWLLDKYPYLASLREDKNLTSLQLLAQMPTASVPHFEKIKWKMLIYICTCHYSTNCCMRAHVRILYIHSNLILNVVIHAGLPDGGDVVTPNQKDDVESSMDSNHPHQSIFRNKLAVVMKAYYSLLDSFAKGTGGPLGEIIYMIWKEKKNKKSLKKLIGLLVQLDDPYWLITNKNTKIRTISLGTKSDTTNGDGGGDKTKSDGCEKDKEVTTLKKEARNEVYNTTPLLIATITGFLPIVQEILEQRPQAVEQVNENERNILHLAIKHRQKEILDIIQSKPTLMSKLNKRIDHKGNTILHQAADRTYYSIALSQKLIGPAMQLQEELRWMLHIKEMLPPHYIMHHNDNDQTAEELFNAGHDELLKSAQEWVKETAQSCSTVAVLVATVVFAAAYAIPGGFNDKSGRPVFQDNPLFLLFTCMDVVAIASSLSSVAFFLSVLSSPLEYPYFVKSIPHKVMLGFVLLFFSMATTMLAFAATILLLIRVKKKWTMSLLYPIAFFPVPLFGLLQFPMYQCFRAAFLAFTRRDQFGARIRQKKGDAWPGIALLGGVESAGIVPVVDEILEQNPQAVKHVNYNERTIFLFEIKHRQKPTLKLIKSKPTNERIDCDGNTILHQDADRSFYCIALDITTTLQHAPQQRGLGSGGAVASGQRGICSRLRHSWGTILLFASPAWTVWSLPAHCLLWLSFSLSSPLHSSTCFHKQPSIMVRTGIFLLLFSMVPTMLAFAATILLLIPVVKKWTKSLVHPIAFFPVPLLGLLQFPMYKSFKVMFQTNLLQ
ncbi:hypothetical protein DVH24_010869 [Malus domestica]|uniref:PGG domain-containing protein n=1 Tax=Malus domestica TaxID=3750 RepID=A0A498JXP5_MALDO|nr:hypothetical protein DVH24_010869 [Malus domestica]